jgi:hypothetical protein
MDSMDARLETALRRPEPAIGDDGFSDAVMRTLPAKRFGGARAGRWTLGGAAAAGSVFASLFGAPLENAFSSLVWGGVDATSTIAVLFVAIVAVPVVWVFYSK